MTKFLARFFILFIIFSSLLSVVLLTILGEPTKESWGFLIDFDNTELPLLLTFLYGIFSISFIIAIWMTIISKRRDALAIKQIKGVNELNQRVLANKRMPKKLTQTLSETFDLIETQRTLLQRLSNEKVETNDSIVQERLLIERQRLARELHDSVSQQLFAASMLLSALTEQAENNETSQQLKQVERMVQQAQLEMRALLLHLRPIALHNKTLAEGLEDLIIELQEKVYFNITYQIEEIPLSKAEEDHFFRIAQEALSNTLRHAKANEVELLYIKRDDQAILRIQDNGRGFNVDDDKMSSYGLRNIAERAVEIGCTYKIVSVEGEGTIVEVKAPLFRKEDSVDQRPNRR